MSEQTLSKRGWFTVARAELKEAFRSLRKGNIPYVALQQQWTIGICLGASPLSLSNAAPKANPVLTARDVTDVSAEFVADPFMLRENETWYMFFEVQNGKTHRGCIGLATSQDGLRWSYRQIVLEESIHLSYPCVFKSGEKYYMVPESMGDGIRLYEAAVFPTRWQCLGTLIKGYHADPTPFEHEGRWWMFATQFRKTGPNLHLYYSQDLLGPWQEHPSSPVAKNDPGTCRSGGRVIIYEGQIVRFAQDNTRNYGDRLRAFVVSELTPSAYREDPVPTNPVPKTSWNRMGTHNVDAHQQADGGWIACVDGYRQRALRIGRAY